MGFRGTFPVNLTWVSIFLFLFLFPDMVKTQMPGCSFQGLGLEQCLNQGKNSMSIEQSCCIALNQAVQASFHCLCMLLASSKPELTTPLLFPLSNCFISVPPLTQCQGNPTVSLFKTVYLFKENDFTNRTFIHKLI